MRDLQQRTESYGSGTEAFSHQIRTFRLERYDELNNRLAPIPVEMRGQTLWGVVNDGDWVEIPRTWSANQNLQPLELTNLTTGAKFGVRGSNRRARKILLRLAFLCIAVIPLSLGISAARGTISAGPPALPIFFGFAGFIAVFVLLIVESVLWRRKLRAPHESRQEANRDGRRQPG